MKQVVWIYGISAAGKETLINTLVDNPPSALLDRLGLNGQKLVACQDSIKWIGQFLGDPVTQKREGILASVPELLHTSDAVLVKSQDVDFYKQRPQRLQSRLPDARHRLIYIDVTPKEAFARWPQKSWWDGTETYEDVVTEYEGQMKTLAELEGFDVITVAAKDQNYKFIPKPEGL